MTCPRSKAILFFCIGWALAQAQSPSPAGEPRFEVASIKKSLPGPGGVLYHLPGGRFKVERYTLLDLITFSYEVPERRVVGLPGWGSSDRYDIEAVGEGEAESDPRRMETPVKKAMVRQLLRDRFGLVIRREERDSAIYSLLKAPNGPRLLPNTDKPYSIQVGKRSYLFHKVSMADLANFMTNNMSTDIGRTVVDRTQVQGEYDFKLTWVPVKSLLPNSSQNDQASHEHNAILDEPPDVFTALQQELGLKLVPDRGRESFLIVERATPPSGN